MVLNAINYECRGPLLPDIYLSLVKKHCFGTVFKSFKGTIYQSFSTDLIKIKWEANLASKIFSGMTEDTLGQGRLSLFSRPSQDIDNSVVYNTNEEKKVF